MGCGRDSASCTTQLPPWCLAAPRHITRTHGALTPSQAAPGYTRLPAVLLGPAAYIVCGVFEIYFYFGNARPRMYCIVLYFAPRVLVRIVFRNGEMYCIVDEPGGSNHFTPLGNRWGDVRWGHDPHGGPPHVQAPCGTLRLGFEPSQAPQPIARRPHHGVFCTASAATRLRVAVPRRGP